MTRESLVGSPRRIKEKLMMRERLCEEQAHRCCYCSVRFGARIRNWTPEMTRATVEHIIPSCLGGSDDWENLAAACWRCNHLRGNEPALEFFARQGWVRNARERSWVRGGWLPRAIRRAVPEMA